MEVGGPSVNWEVLPRPLQLSLPDASDFQCLKHDDEMQPIIRKSCSPVEKVVSHDNKMRCFDRRYPYDVSVYITSSPSDCPIPVILLEPGGCFWNPWDVFQEKYHPSCVYISHATYHLAYWQLRSYCCQNINPNISQVLDVGGGESSTPMSNGHDVMPLPADFILYDLGGFVTTHTMVRRWWW